MTQQEFIKPGQCNNCKVLHRRIEDYYKTSDDFSNSAIETGLESERAARTQDAPLEEIEAKAELTSLLLGAAALISKGLREKLQKDMDEIGGYCMGTDDPISPELQDCNNIQNQFK
jgi:hypothetical protein